MDNQVKDKAGVIMFPPLLYLIAIIISIGVSYLFPYQFLQQPLALIIGIILMTAAGILLFFAPRELVRNKTTVHPKGSSKAIVTTGLYQYTRNPMYVAFTVFLLGICIATNSWFVYIIIIPLLVIVQKGIIEREEKYLTRKFGETYTNYKSKVRRWI